MLTLNPRATRTPYPADLAATMNIARAHESRQWLATWPQIAPTATPLRELPDMAAFDEASVLLEVADNGAGMTEQAEARLFVPFTSSKPTGLGIGLSICRSFVELHQGRLWFSRNDDGGCTFHFRLPLAHAASAASTASGASPVETRGAPS